MNSKLKKVFDEASKLSDEDQEQLAAIIEEELANEEAWQSAFENSQPQLQKMAEEAREEYRAGRTEPLDPDSF